MSNITCNMWWCDVATTTHIIRQHSHINHVQYVVLWCGLKKGAWCVMLCNDQHVWCGVMCHICDVDCGVMQGVMWCVMQCGMWCNITIESCAICAAVMWREVVHDVECDAMNKMRSDARCVFVIWNGAMWNVLQCYCTMLCYITPPHGFVIWNGAWCGLVNEIWDVLQCYRTITAA